MSLFRNRILMQKPVYIDGGQIDVYNGIRKRKELYKTGNITATKIRCTAMIKAPTQKEGKCCFLGGHVNNSAAFAPFIVIDGKYAYEAVRFTPVITDYEFDDNFHFIDYTYEANNVFIKIDGEVIVNTEIQYLTSIVKVNMGYNGMHIFSYNGGGGRNTTFMNYEGAALKGPMNIYLDDKLFRQYTPTYGGKLIKTL